MGLDPPPPYGKYPDYFFKFSNRTQVWRFVHSYFNRQAIIKLRKALSVKLARKIIPFKGIFLGRMNMFGFI